MAAAVSRGCEAAHRTDPSYTQGRALDFARWQPVAKMLAKANSDRHGHERWRVAQVRKSETKHVPMSKTKKSPWFWFIDLGFRVSCFLTRLVCCRTRSALLVAQPLRGPKDSREKRSRGEVTSSMKLNTVSFPACREGAGLMSFLC